MQFIKSFFYLIKKYFLKKIKIKIVNIFLFNKHKFELSKIRKILLLNFNKKIDDIIVSTMLIKEIKKYGYTIDVLTNKKNASIIKFNPYINNIFLFNKIKKKYFINKIKKNLYDLIIDTNKLSSFKYFLFLKKISSSNIIGFNKKKYKIYNKSIKYNDKEHLTYKYQSLMKYLNIKNFNINYDIFIQNKTKKSVGDFLKSLPGRKKIFINPFDIDKKKSMSVIQINNLIYLLKRIWPDCDFILNNFLLKNKKISKLYIKIPFNDLHSISEIIRNSDLIISSNISIVHIAATWKKNTIIIIYKNNMFNNINYISGYEKMIQIITNDKHHISTIKVLKIINIIKKMHVL